MSAKHSTHWFWSDWLGDQQVRRLTPAERGVWIDLIGLAAVGSPTGYVCDDKGKPLPLEELARVTNAGSVEAVAELINGILEKGAASRDRAGRLFNRRMVRDAELSAKRKLAGQKGGAHTKLKWRGFLTLPQQVPQQSVGPPSNKKSIISSVEHCTLGVPSGPMAEPSKKNGRLSEPASGPAPSQVGRAELETIYEKKRGVG